MKILFFDVDGTIFDNELKTVHKSTLDSLKKLHESNKYLLFLATGRAPFYMKDIEEIYNLFDGIISLNGHHITYKGKTLRHIYFNDKEKNLILNTLKKHNLSCGYQSIYKEEIDSKNDLFLNIFKKLNINIPGYINSVNEALEPSQIYFFSNEEMSKIIQSELNDFDVVYWGSNEGSDILKKNVSKYEAIQFVIKSLNIQNDEVYTFGDGTNDIDMIKNFANSTCMGNGAESTKKVAGFVTDNMNNNGLEKAIKHYNLL